MEKSLEGSGKVPRIVQVMYFKGMPRQMNQQPEVGLPQQWEAQWQEFLNTLQPPAHAGWGNLQLTDTVPWDDTWAFLAAFEQVAEACQWPREEWVRQLLPALRGGMEQSFCRLDARDRGDYMKVKAAILRADALRMEMKRQHFRQCCYQELEGPRRVYSQLQDLCRQWLKPEKHTKEQILEMIIQEQLLGMLPAEVQNWVRECGPKDCIEMVALAEDFLTGHRHPPRSCDWQVPLPEVPASSSESEGRQRQHHPGASEATSTRNSVLAHSSAGLEMTGTGTTEQPVRVKEELGLDQKPIHWEVMQERSSSFSALEGLLVPTPELNSQVDEPQATFQERPEHRDPIPDTLFGTHESNKGHSNSTQELLGEPSTVLLSAVSDSDPVSRPHPNGLKTLKVMLKKLPSAQKGEYKGPVGDRRVPELSKTIKDRRAHPGERSYDCSDCGKAFRKPYHLYRHQSGIACRKPKPIICDAVFAEEKIDCRGGRIIGEIRIETFQQAISEAEDDFGTLRGEESSGTVPLNPESSPLDPEKQLGARQPEEVRKRKCPQRRRRACKKKGKRSPLEKKYTCLECGYEAYYYSNLLRHMKSHAAKELHECLECGKIYRDRPCFENHVRSHLPLDDPNRRVERARTRNSSCQMKEECTCFTCGVVKSSPSALAEHMKVHTDERPYECPECGKLFKWQSNLSRHRGLHTSRRFSSRQLMRRGINESNKGHSNSTQELLGEPSTVLLSAVSDSDPVSRPHPNGLKTLKVMLKKLPSAQKGEYKGPVGDRRVPELSKTIKDRRAHPGERSYDCSDCGKAFRKPYHLYRHQSGIACRKPRPILCDAIFAEEKIDCRGEEESRSATLLQENIKLEDEDGAYPACNDQPSLRSNLKTEQREGSAAGNEASEHPNTKMHSCTKCGYQTAKLSDILKHFRNHNKEKPYKCLDCGKCFRWFSTLIKHQQTHVASPQPPVIAECDVTLSDDEELINILAKKPPRQDAGVRNFLERPSKRSPAAVCPVSKSSRVEASPAIRSREQNGKGKAARHRKKSKKTRYEGLEKKHECLDCGHRTYFLSDLVRHKRAHPNETPYRCPECQKLFVQPSFLKLHLKTHKTERKSVNTKKAPQGERKYTCSKCGHKTYKLSTHLLHMRTHMSEKERAYICDECGKAFKWSSNLSRHKRIHALNEGFKIRRPTFSGCYEINRDDETPKKTSRVRLKKIRSRFQASTAPEMEALREHWRNYKRQQRKKSTEKPQKTEEKEEKERRKEEKENVAEKEVKEEEESRNEEEESRNEEKENVAEKEVKEKNVIPELSLRARLEKFAYSKSRGKEPRQEVAASDPKVSAEELLHHECTVCGKNFTYDGHLADHQNLHTEAKPHRCQECQK